MTASDPDCPPSPEQHGHPALDTLAELDAELLDPAGSTPLRAHVAGCAQCQAELAGLEDVRAMLRGLPPPRMPAIVAERILAALAAQRPAPADRDPGLDPTGLDPTGLDPTEPAADAPVPLASLAEARRRRRRNGLVGLAAAGVVLVAGTVIGLAGTSPRPGHGSPGASGTSGGTPSPANPPSFTRDTLTNAPVLADILNGRGGGILPQAGTNTLAGSMTDPQQRQSCEAGIAAEVPGLTGRSAGVQYIRFEGTRGYLFVYLTGGRRKVVVVGTDCSSSAAHVLYTQTVR
jgi:hypothetical protein